MKRRTVNVFSLSFIDCICCGLGAIILLFVIVNAKSAVQRNFRKRLSALTGVADKFGYDLE